MNLRAFAIMGLMIGAPAIASSATQRSNELAISLGHYHYEEPGLMALNGWKSGIDLRFTRPIPGRRLFLRGEFRYAVGRVDYTSKDTGSSNGEPDWYLEGRMLIGNDWSLQRGTLAPYIGLGYRFLLNDGRGLSTTGSAGYRRESNYIYLPAGISYRTPLSGSNELSGSIEYDHLLSGNQFTRLSDASASYSDLNSKQTDGYGIKMRLRYVTPRWSIGPYLHYWNIADSAYTPIYLNGVLRGYGLEPYNKTLEIGLELSQPF